jgi:anti-sigma regulatory factor (Ser/Thr protein kinase)
MDEFMITVERNEDMVVAALGGALTLRTAPAVRAALLKCLVECPAALIVDVARLTVDSDLPLTVFRAVQRQATRWPGIPMVLCRPTSALASRLAGRATGRHLPVHATVEQAIAAAQRPISARPTVRADLPASVHAGRRARDVVVQACSEWGLDTRAGDAEVIVSELASNAVRHAVAPLQLLVAVRGDYLHIAVRDGSPRLPQPTDLTASRPDPIEHGRGLHLIAALAISWGCVPTSDGKVVWATLRVQPRHFGIVR